MSSIDPARDYPATPLVRLIAGAACVEACVNLFSIAASTIGSAGVSYLATKRLSLASLLTLLTIVASIFGVLGASFLKQAPAPGRRFIIFWSIATISVDLVTVVQRISRYSAGPLSVQSMLATVAFFRGSVVPALVIATFFRRDVKRLFANEKENGRAFEVLPPASGDQGPL